MEFLNNITQGRGKVITSASAAVLATLIFLADIHIVAKIVAVIALTVVAACLILSLIQKTLAKKKDVSTQTEEQSDILGDEGYSTGDETEEDVVISAEERKKTEVQRQEELANARECERMEQGSLGGPINALGDPIPEKPNTNISMETESRTKKQPSPAERLSRYGGDITNNSVRMPERLTMEYILDQRN